MFLADCPASGSQLVLIPYTLKPLTTGFKSTRLIVWPRFPAVLFLTGVIMGTLLLTALDSWSVG